MIRLPAEWAAQSAVMLVWPTPEGPRAHTLAAVEAELCALAAAVTRYQPLLIVAADDLHAAHITVLLRRTGEHTDRLRIATAPSDDIWCRDYGPLTVIEPDSGQARLIDFRFNGWGGKYPAAHDDRLTTALQGAGVFGNAPCHHSTLVLEGGALETDGHGTLLATERSIVDEARNPGKSREDMEFELRRLLGLRRFLWLQNGQIAGDDTDGHIDTLARFSDPHTVVYQGCDDPEDEHYEPLQAMARELRKFHDIDGQPYRLLPLPLPPAIHDDDGQRLPATYANFLIINGAVLAPVYDVDTDEEALAQLAVAFPGRAIEPVPCRELIADNGSLHCVTMQFPRVITVEEPR